MGKTPKKLCSGCNETKPLTEFGQDRSKPSGYHSRCRMCKRKRYDRPDHDPLAASKAEARQAALEHLAGQFPTQFARAMRSEYLKRGLAENTLRSA